MEEHKNIAHENSNTSAEINLGNKPYEEMLWDFSRHESEMENIVKKFVTIIQEYHKKYWANKLGLVIAVGKYTDTASFQQMLDGNDEIENPDVLVMRALKKKLTEKNINNIEFFAVKIFYKNDELNEISFQSSLEPLKKFQEENGENGTLVVIKNIEKTRPLTAAMLERGLKKIPQEKISEDDDVILKEFFIISYMDYAEKTSGSHRFSLFGQRTGKNKFSQENNTLKDAKDVLRAFGNKAEILSLLGCESASVDKIGTVCTLTFSNQDQLSSFKKNKINHLAVLREQIHNHTVQKDKKIRVDFPIEKTWLMLAYLLLQRRVNNWANAQDARISIQEHFAGENADNRANLQALEKNLNTIYSFGKEESKTEGSPLADAFQKIFHALDAVTKANVSRKPFLT